MGEQEFRMVQSVCLVNTVHIQSVISVKSSEISLFINQLTVSIRRLVGLLFLFLERTEVTEYVDNLRFQNFLWNRKRGGQRFG